MLIYPAIDLKDGVCVRLMHGKFDQVTQYDEQPAARLTAFATEGAQWIHIVDLDGAEAGEARQHGLIGELTQAIDVKIQSGGGVRGANDVAKLLEGVADGAYAYFVHGYVCPDGPATLARADYGGPVPAVVRSANRWGCQFHPERSAKAGAVILKNFLELPA